MPSLLPVTLLNVSLRKQRGAVLMVMLIIIVIGSAAFLISAMSHTSIQIEQDQKTAQALAQAKEALIGFAAAVDLRSTSSKRPGDLPCPDTDNDGISGGFTIFSCNTQAQRIGRLPWKTLGLPDIRDSSGERLWYAVSNNFKNFNKTSCNAPGMPGCLNSDSVGTITIRNSDGNILNDASTGNGVVAVVFAPGQVLQRQLSPSPQNRTCSIGVDCDPLDVCLLPTSQKCVPVNYLDGVSAEDNADFTDSTPNGFIQGTIRDSSNNIILNDQLLTITQDNIMQVIQKRVANEVRNCLVEYAKLNNNRYPWAAPITTFNDNTNQLFGHIPDNLTYSLSDFGGLISSGSWGSSCNTHISNTPKPWWTNWKDIVFYGLADAYKPSTSPANPSCGTCLAVTNISAIHDKKLVVIVAGKTLPSQPPRLPTNIATYLEGNNELADQSGGYTFFKSAPSINFNDLVIYQ